MKLRSKVGHITGQVAARGLSLLGRPGTTLPGYLAEHFSDTVLTDLMQNRDYTTKIIVTGTNGKTTTTRLLMKLLEAQGLKVISNSSGSNLYRGVTTAVITDKKRNDYEKTALLLEVDEASMPRVAEAVQPTHIVVLNLFRDQLDRYGEVSTTQSYLKQAIGEASQSELVLCADDPWVAMLGIDHDPKRVTYFGLDMPELRALPHDEAADYPISPQTHEPLVYTQRYFSHLGDYEARDKSWQRPLATTLITGYKEANDQIKITYTLSKEHHDVTTKLKGIYNAYNIGAVIALADKLKLPTKLVKSVLAETSAAFGRQEVIEQGDTSYQLYLIKNPTGFNQVISSVFWKNEGDSKSTLIIINDNFADGRDISWLWDVAIEDMVSHLPIIVAGQRAYDMALRLEYAGKECVVADSIEQGLELAGKQAKQVRILPTYTALLEVRKLLGLSLGEEQ